MSETPASQDPCQPQSSSPVERTPPPDSAGADVSPAPPPVESEAVAPTLTPDVGVEKVSPSATHTTTPTATTTDPTATQVADPDSPSEKDNAAKPKSEGESQKSEDSKDSEHSKKSKEPKKPEEPKKPVEPKRGVTMRGRVSGTDSDHVLLDIGTPATAAIPLAQFDGGTVPDVGTELDLIILDLDESADRWRAYRCGAVVASDTDPLLPGMVLDGMASGMIKGGLEIQFGKLRGFLPSSQVDTSPIKDISVLLGESVRCEVLELDKKKKKVIVSRRVVLRRQEEEARKNMIAHLAVGQVHTGTVVSLADFGAFVDLGGIRGLVHISDLRWTPVEKPSDVVKVGDSLEVKVLRVNKDRKRISLGHKQVIPDPWSKVAETFTVDQRIKAKVVKLTEFGAFAEVAEGVNGLIPLSEMSWGHRVADAQTCVEVGQEVDVQVISVDPARHRIGLSIKRLTEDPWAGVAEAFPADSVVTGKVTALLDFGALIELKPGVEGMVHISELSHQRVKTPADVAKVDQEVEVKVLAVDRKKRRISLTIKGLTEPDKDTKRSADSTKPRKKRTKPLRGGLSSHFEW